MKGASQWERGELTSYPEKKSSQSNLHSTTFLRDTLHTGCLFHAKRTKQLFFSSLIINMKRSNCSFIVMKGDRRAQHFLHIYSAFVGKCPSTVLHLSVCMNSIIKIVIQPEAYVDKEGTLVKWWDENTRPVHTNIFGFWVDATTTI